MRPHAHNARPRPRHDFLNFQPNYGAIKHPFWAYTPKKRLIWLKTGVWGYIGGVAPLLGELHIIWGGEGQSSEYNDDGGITFPYHDIENKSTVITEVK